MFRLRNFLPLIAVALLALPNSASAAFQFQVKITDQTGPIVPGTTQKTFNYDGVSTDLDGNAIITVSSVVGDFAVSFEIVVSNSPGGPTLAILSQSASSVTNRALTTQTLNILVSATDYTAPISPPDIMLGSALSGTVTSGAVSGVTFNSYVGTTNALYEQAIAGQTVGPATASGPSGSLSGNTHTQITVTSNPYSLTSSLTATFAGSAMVTNLSGNTTLTSVVPEPATMLMALGAMPLLGLGWLRRRRAQQQV